MPSLRMGVATSAKGLRVVKSCAFWVEDQFLVVAPVPFCKFMVFHIMLKEAWNLWEKCGENTELFTDNYQPLLQQIADLFPRLDRPTQLNETGWNTSQMSLAAVRDFFFYQTSLNGEILPCKLLELNQVEPSETGTENSEPQEGDDISEWNPPIKSCGDTELDMIGQLIGALGIDSLKLCDRFDYNSISLLIQAYNASQEPPEERRKQYMIKYYDNYKQQNSAAIGQALGLGDFDIRTISQG